MKIKHIINSAAIILLLNFNISLSQPANSPWPIFHHDVRHTGKSDFLGPQDSLIAWTFQTGGAIEGEVVIGSDNIIYFGSTDGKLYALNPDGTLKWSRTFSAEINTTPAISVDDKIYISVDSVFCLNTYGAVIWKYHPGTYLFKASSPVLMQDGGIIFNSTTSDGPVFGSEGRVTILNQDGSLRWQSRNNGFAFVPALDDNDTIYAVGYGVPTCWGCYPAGGGLQKFSPTGDSIWTFILGNVKVGPILDEEYNTYMGSGVFGGVVYTGEYTVIDRNGKQLYLTTSITAYGGNNEKSSAIYSGWVYYVDYGRLVCSNPLNGGMGWAYYLNEYSYEGASSPTLDKNRNVYIGSATGKLFCLDSTGVLKWSKLIGSPILTSGSISSMGVLYIGANNGKLYAIGSSPTLHLSTPNGGENWQVEETYDISWSSSGVSNVKIDYTIDNGTSWLPIIESTPSNGLYSWTILNTPSTECKIRITAVDNPSISDESDGVFQIAPQFPDLNVTYYAPNSVNDQGIFTDQIILDQSRLILGIQLFLSSPPHMLYNVKVNAYLNGVPINVQLNSSRATLDYDEDGLIDEFSFGVYFLIYSNTLLENLIDADIKLVIEEIEGFSTDIQFDKTVSYYFAKNTQDKTFKLSFDSYKFRNLTKLSWEEFRSLDIPYSTLMLLGELFARISSSWMGRCWGMSATAGKYFLDPSSKPYPSNLVYIWEDTDVLVTNPITYAHLNQIIFLYNQLHPPSNYEAFQKLNNYFLEHKPSLLSIWKEGELIGHAVLATSMTLLDAKANIRVYDSNYPYNLASGEGDGCFTYDVNTHTFNSSFFYYNYDRFDAFTGLVFDVNTNIISFDILTEKLRKYLFDNNLKQFSSACPVNLLIKDSQGLSYGFDENGYFIDEIPNCNFLKVPADTLSTDSITVIYAPDGEDYNVEINSYDQGSLLFVINQTEENNSLKSYYADSVSVTPSTIVTYNEKNPDNNLLIDYNGDGITDTTINLDIITTDIDEYPRIVIPSEFKLFQNYPNPFNPSTRIKYSIPQISYVTLTIYDILGNEIKTLVDEEKTAGFYEVQFNGSNIASGLYFYRLQAGDFTETKKLILLK